LVDVLAERGIQCRFYTNGTLLRSRTIEGIVSRGNIFKVEVSCDGAQKETFEGLRRGADFDRWKAGVGELAARAKAGANGPRRPLRVGALTVLSKQTLGEIEAIIRLAAALGLCASQTEYSAIRPEKLRILGRTVGTDVFFELRREKTPPRTGVRCLQPWHYAFLRANGDVAPCCAVFGSEKAAVMGNLLQEDFHDVWHGERFREFRRTSASGTNKLCRICPYY
jgi:radical SAM protein with 4Fe4S-binding SPASM domain